MKTKVKPRDRARRDITSDIVFCPARPGDGHYDYDGWCWSVYLNNIQYASEILPERSAKEAQKNIMKYTKKALKEDHIFYFESFEFKRNHKTGE